MHITTLLALLAGCEAFIQRPQDEGFIQELDGAQPHLADGEPEDEMERMVHLAGPQREVLSGAASLEASGFFDLEDREGGDPREDNHTGPDLDLLIGYGVSDHRSPTVMEEDEGQTSGALLPSIADTNTNKTETEIKIKIKLKSESEASAAPSAQQESTTAPAAEETTDSELKEDALTPSGVFTQNPTGVGGQQLEGLSRLPSDWLGEATPPPAPPGSEVSGGGGTEEAQQVVCIDWKELSGRGYIVLNITHNWNCEEFRADQGVRLLRIVQRVFAGRMGSPEGLWVIYLSKPTHQQHQLLMNLASVHGVISTKEVLGMLGEIKSSLNKMGVQGYSAARSCPLGLSPARSDYGKLFVVLVIIGSVCMIIITTGFIYICWQRRLNTAKTTFRAEELHFVENGCHDNPTLDVANDSQPEQREKPSTNGMAGGGGGGGAEGSRWQVFVNQGATEEEEEEQDTHL